MLDTEILDYKVPTGTYVMMNPSLLWRPEPVLEKL